MPRFPQPGSLPCPSQFSLQALVLPSCACRESASSAAMRKVRPSRAWPANDPVLHRRCASRKLRARASVSLERGLVSHIGTPIPASRRAISCAKCPPAGNTYRILLEDVVLGSHRKKKGAWSSIGGVKGATFSRRRSSASSEAPAYSRKLASSRVGQRSKSMSDSGGE